MSYARARCGLLVFSLLAMGWPPAWAQRHPAGGAWLTTPDQAQLLHRQHRGQEVITLPGPGSAGAYIWQL